MKLIVGVPSTVKTTPMWSVSQENCGWWAGLEDMPSSMHEVAATEDIVVTASIWKSFFNAFIVYF